MLSDELLIHLFAEEVARLGEEKGLGPRERQKITDIFTWALNDRFMDERRIYALMTEKDSEDDSGKDPA